MARAPMVTRTIQTTETTVLCLDINKGEPFNQKVVLPRTYKDEKHMLKAAEKVINSDAVKAVHIVDSVVKETLYGMSEQDFITFAKVLPPRNSNADGYADTDSMQGDEDDQI